MPLTYTISCELILTTVFIYETVTNIYDMAEKDLYNELKGS